MQIHSAPHLGQVIPYPPVAPRTVTRRPPIPLQKWRLRRVLDYVDRHLGGPIKLPDLAVAAGLTRMHFAAQFRAAVGVRPHHYVLRRRIDRACELLRNPELTLVEIALGVGFQTQAHFTTVFRRIVGETPLRWRRCVRLHSNAHRISDPAAPCRGSR